MKLSLSPYSALIFLQVLFQRFIHITAIFRHTYVEIIPSEGLSRPAYQSHVLTCKASYLGEAPDVEWIKNTGLRVENHPRFGVEVTYNPHETEVISHLYFYDALPSDSGTYICRMLPSASGMSEVHVQFWTDCLANPFTAMLLRPVDTCEIEYHSTEVMIARCSLSPFAKCGRPKKPDPVIKPMWDVTLQPGSEQTIACQVQGGFEGAMLWSKDGRFIGSTGSYDMDGDHIPDIRISPQTHSLTISNAKSSDAGVYDCRFRYRSGSRWKSIADRINVYAGVDIISDSYILWQGHQNKPLQVKCLASGYPLPIVSWSYGTKQISLYSGSWAGDISIYDSQITHVQRQSVLNIAKMPGFFNITKFNCKGQNRIDSKSNTIMVVNVGTTLIPGSGAMRTQTGNILLLLAITISSEILRR